MDGCLIMHKLCSTIGLFTLPRSRLYPIRSSETSRPPLGMWVSSQATSSSVLSLHVLLWPPKSLGSLTFLWLSIIWVPPLPLPSITLRHFSSLSGQCFTTVQKSSETWSGSYLMRSTILMMQRSGDFHNHFPPNCNWQKYSDLIWSVSLFFFLDSHREEWFGKRCWSCCLIT